MTGSEELKGLWWLPEEDDEQELSGTLHVTKGRVELELLGDFGHALLRETGREKHYSLDLAERSRILGISTDGKPITLEGHIAAPHTVHLPGIPTSTYLREVALVGKHFAEGEEIAFDEISIEASDLNEWTRVSGFDFQIKMKQDEDAATMVFSDLGIAFDGPEALEFELSRGETATIRFRGDSKGLAAGTSRIELQQKAALHLRPARRAGLEEVFARTLQVRNLLSLAVGRPVSIFRVTGYNDDYCNQADSRKPIELYWEVPYNPEPPASGSHPREMLFTLPEASPDFSTVWT